MVIERGIPALMAIFTFDKSSFTFLAAGISKVDYITFFHYHKYMFDSFISYLLALFLQFACCVRILFTKNSRIDSIVVLTPVAFIISILNFYIWGANYFSCFFMVFSFLVLLTNGRSLFRLAARLYIDRYSPLFVISTVLEMLIIIFSIAVLIFFFPVRINSKTFNVTETKQSYPDKNNLSLSEAFVYTLQGESPREDYPVIVFSGTETSSFCDYEPFLLFLAQKGCTIVYADVFKRDDQPFNWKEMRIFKKDRAIIQALTQKQEPQPVEDQLKNNIYAYQLVMNMAAEKFGPDRKVFFIFDVLDYDSICRITDLSGEKFSGFYSLNRIPEYKTPGFGFIEQSNVVLAKRFGLTRDKSLFIPRYCSSKVLTELKTLYPDPEPQTQPEAPAQDNPAEIQDKPSDESSH